MAIAPDSEIQIAYQDAGVAPELWAATQANFAVRFPGAASPKLAGTLHTREFAILVNDAAMEYLTGQLGVEDSPEIRKTLARIVGEAYLPIALASSADPLVMVARATFAESPGLLAEVRSKFSAL